MFLRMSKRFGMIAAITMNQVREALCNQLRSQAMDNNQNPVYTKGDRNVFCPYYRNCLDYAVELQWEYWACSDCQHTQKEILVTDVLLLPVDTDPYYSFPRSFHKKAANISL